MQLRMQLTYPIKTVFIWPVVGCLILLSLATMLEGGAAGASNGEAMDRRVEGAQRVADRVDEVISWVFE